MALSVRLHEPAALPAMRQLRSVQAVTTHTIALVLFIESHVFFVLALIAGALAS